MKGRWRRKCLCTLAWALAGSRAARDTTGFAIVLYPESGSELTETSAASRHDHDGRDRDFWSGVTEVLVSDGHIQKCFSASTIGGLFHWSILSRYYKDIHTTVFTVCFPSNNSGRFLIG